MNEEPETIIKPVIIVTVDIVNIVLHPLCDDNFAGSIHFPRDHLYPATDEFIILLRGMLHG